MAIAFRAAETAANGAATTSITLSRPAGTADGDGLVAFVAISADQTITTVPAGWNLLDSRNTGTATGDCRHSFYWKVAAGEPASWLWGFSAAADSAAVVAAYSGTSAAPIQTSAVNLMATSTTTHTAASVTPTSTSTHTIFAFAVNPVYNGNTTFTTPSGLTARAEADPGAGTTNRAVLKIFDLSTPTATATGTKTTTLNNNAKGVAFSVVLAPSGVVAQSIVLDSRAAL